MSLSVKFSSRVFFSQYCGIFKSTVIFSLAARSPALGKKNSKIIFGPKYRGVNELGESGVSLLITCECSEADIDPSHKLTIEDFKDEPSDEPEKK